MVISLGFVPVYKLIATSTNYTFLTEKTQITVRQKYWMLFKWKRECLKVVAVQRIELQDPTLRSKR